MKIKFILDVMKKLCYNNQAGNLGVAQLVARYLGVVEAASSSLVTQTKYKKARMSYTYELFAIFE